MTVATESETYQDIKSDFFVPTVCVFMTQQSLAILYCHSFLFNIQGVLKYFTYIDTFGALTLSEAHHCDLRIMGGIPTVYIRTHNWSARLGEI